MIRLLLALTLVSATAVPAAADERRTLVTAFDRVRVEGPFAVEIATGASPSATAIGESRALDAVNMAVEDRMLVVRGSPNGWGGWPGARREASLIRITTPHLNALSVTGAASVRVDAMKGAEVSINLTGSGRIEVATIDADRLEAIAVGSGALKLGGNARTARLLNNGVATIDAEQLSVRDLTLQSESAGDSRAHATQTARATALGMGGVTVTGPAACTRTGPGPIACGE